MATAIAIPLTAARAARVLRPGRLAACILTADSLAVILSFALAIGGRALTSESFPLDWHLQLWPLAALFPAAYALFGLYPGVATCAARELRQQSIATTLMYILLGAFIFLSRSGEMLSRASFITAWALTLALAPLLRASARRLFGKCSWWGHPVIVFGGGQAAREVVEEMRKQPQSGLQPIAVVDDSGESGDWIGDVPVLGNVAMAPVYGLNLGVSRAVVAMGDVRSEELSQLVESSAQYFSHVYVMTPLSGLTSLSVDVRDVGQVLALEFQRSLLVPSRQRIKRVADALASGLLMALLSPLLALIAVLIRLESRGPALFSQNRLGRDGRHFRMWKFRSMHTDGARILAEHFVLHPQAREEWERTQKLQGDPRVTPLGRILRKTSLDELPQLWNVLRGDMSLVGPRPIVDAEIEKYGDAYRFYTRVLPGLTGMWQVSGRSDTTYRERTTLDTAYVRNWSVWLDVYLLARTVSVVLSGRGAY